jgi:hypothetical protein
VYKKVSNEGVNNMLSKEWKRGGPVTFILCFVLLLFSYILEYFLCFLRNSGQVWPAQGIMEAEYAQP